MGPLESEYNRKCLYHTKDDRIILSDCKGGSNQQWYFDGKRVKSKLGQTNKCLDYSTPKGVVYMRLAHLVGLSELRLVAREWE